MADEKRIEVGRNLSLDRSPFSLNKFGLKEDPTKDRRWVAPDRIDERKYNDGYKLVPGGSAEDGTHRTRGRMVLMERPRELAEESARLKQEKTRAQQGAARKSLREEYERLSSKHGIDLHKHLKETEEDN